jgi:hypothetical protein
MQRKQNEGKWNVFDAWNKFVDKNIDIDPDIKGNIGDIMK